MKDIELALREVVDAYRSHLPKTSVLLGIRRQLEELEADTGYDDKWPSKDGDQPQQEQTSEEVVKGLMAQPDTVTEGQAE